ncbi:MAG: putative surface protein with fasciclin (FAS1) repeats [Flavobacteriales bacterium]|jgi:uncharacterized surface protein with fasciclin (FAS1) repeats
MKLKKLTFIMAIGTLLFTACTENTTSSTETTPRSDEATPSIQKDSTENPLNVKPNQSTPEAIKAKKDFEKKRDLITAEVNNTTSTYKFITTSEDYSIFGELTKKSSIGKYMHGNLVTVLAPKNKAFDDYPNYLNLMKPGNEEALNIFISSYILIERFSYKAIKIASSVPTYAGDLQKVNDRNGITIGGASISTSESFTLKGNVIGMNELYFVPEEMK